MSRLTHTSTLNSCGHSLIKPRMRRAGRHHRPSIRTDGFASAFDRGDCLQDLLISRVLPEPEKQGILTARHRPRPSRGAPHMLKKFIAVKNVGKFINSAHSGVQEYPKTTLVLGGNGFGKTTLAS